MRYRVIFYNGHVEIVEAQSNIQAMLEARLIYGHIEDRISIVELIV